MRQMYHPDDLAAMDPLVLMKNLDDARITSRRLSYILQQQVHLYTPEVNQVRDQIDRYVEAERQIEGELRADQMGLKPRFLGCAGLRSSSPRPRPGPLSTVGGVGIYG